MRLCCSAVQLEGTSGGPGTELEPCKGQHRSLTRCPPGADSVTHVLQHPPGEELREKDPNGPGISLGMAGFLLKLNVTLTAHPGQSWGPLHRTFISGDH